jgi:hypothetical protein
VALGGIGEVQAVAAAQSAEVLAVAELEAEALAAAGEEGAGQPTLTWPFVAATSQLLITVWPLVALLSVAEMATVGLPVESAVALLLLMAVPPWVAEAVDEAMAVAWWRDRPGRGASRVSAAGRCALRSGYGSHLPFWVPAAPIPMLQASSTRVAT